MLSPIPDSPKSEIEEAVPWKLIKQDSPQRPTRPREPYPIDNNGLIDPRIDYVPINPIKLYCIDYSLQEHEGLSLTTDQRHEVNSLLKEFTHIFEKHGEPTPYAEHKIDTGTHIPISVKPYRLSPIRQQQLRVKLDEMLEADIIEESESPWSAPVVLVPKGENDIRVCIDYRRLNSITVPDRYPLPRMDDLLQQAKAMPYMSTIDLKSGYWQIIMNKEDMDKTTFVTSFGTYRFKRMPFGLRNAPSTFQRLMDKFCRELKAESVLAYLDDLICRSVSFEQHLVDLREIFTKLEQYKLRANRQKCKFGCDSIKYLGHIITPEGIKTDDEKVAAISNMKVPKTLKHLISFLQTASWYRRFIKNFAEVARPLTCLTKKNSSLEMGRSSRKSF